MGQRLKIKRRKDGKAKGVKYRTNKKGISVKIGKRVVKLKPTRRRVRIVRQPRLRRR